MKKRLLIALVACAMALSFALVGCNGSGSTPSQSDFIGIWDISSMSVDGEEYSSENMDSMKAFGAVPVLTIASDGTADISMYGTAMYVGKWKYDNGAATFAIDGYDTPVDLTIKNGKLSLEVDGSGMTFTRTSSEAAHAATVVGATTTSTSDENFEPNVDETFELAIADDDVATLNATGKATDWLDDPGYVIDVTNKTSGAINVRVSKAKFTVNGKSVDGHLDESIDAGATKTAFLWFDSTSIGGNGISDLVGVSGTIEISDANGTLLKSYPFSA